MTIGMNVRFNANSSHWICSDQCKYEPLITLILMQIRAINSMYMPSPKDKSMQLRAIDGLILMQIRAINSMYIFGYYHLIQVYNVL